MEQIKHDDCLVSFYTGFKSYVVFLAFFQFLGPATSKLNYWGIKSKSQKQWKLSPVDQLLMTLMKLRLNLKGLDLSFRFGVSPAAVSRYITTWICFLYNHLKELDWMPSVQQVAGTLPFGNNSPAHTQSLMVARSSWRHQQTFTCNPLLGAIINIIILQKISSCVHTKWMHIIHLPLICRINI